jgi:hypothetical protein
MSKPTRIFAPDGPAPVATYSRVVETEAYTVAGG